MEIFELGGTSFDFVCVTTYAIAIVIIDAKVEGSFGSLMRVLDFDNLWNVWCIGAIQRSWGVS
jgi:hypothetical protein